MCETNHLKFCESFEQAFPALPVKYNVSWHEVTSLGVGGEIPVMAEPPDDMSLIQLVRYCRKQSIPMFVLGGGTNTVGMDKPYNGLVIRLCQNDFIRVINGRRHVTAGAGVRLSDLANICARKGFGGISSLVGIPGTLGGALRMNAGAHGAAIGDFVTELCGFDADGNPWSANGCDIKWGYRTSSIPDGIIITVAILEFPQVDRETELRKISDELKLRRAIEPRGRSAGCVFKNASNSDTAGQLIDTSGCKGMSCGKIVVSDIHANYFMNTDHGFEHDFVDLVCKVRRIVAEKTGFYLNPEVCFMDTESMKKVEESAIPLKVAVLKGGTSSERSVSLESGGSVAKALRNAGYFVDEIDVQDTGITAEMRNADVVFPVLHGGFGENGEIQKSLEDAGLRFVGSGSKASAIIIDKIQSKQLMEKHGLPTAPWAVVTKENRAFPSNLSLPVVIKAPREGSTVGIAIAETVEEWEAGLDKCFAYDSELLVEKFINGMETTVGILNGEPLPVIEIQVPGKIYDFDAKYTHNQGETRYLCPPENISRELQKKAQEIAVKFYQASGARDILRVDIFITKAGEMYVLEGNSLPGFTSSSLVPKAAGKVGMSFEKLCTYLLQCAMKRPAS
jgi:D-alanine-D-alanine ligase